MDHDESIRCLVGHALSDHGFTDIERNESIGNHILANLKEAGLIAALASPAPAGGEAAPNETTLITVIADIREKSGVGSKPMLSELADAIAARITPPPSPDVAGVVEGPLKDTVAMSASAESDRVLQLHFSRPITAADRAALINAHNTIVTLSAEKGRLEAAVAEAAAIFDNIGYADAASRARTALTPKEKA